MIETPEQMELIRGLYVEERAKLLLYAVSSLSDEDLADEAVQETFVIACSKPRALIGHPNPGGWLMKTLIYVLKDMKKGRARMNALLFHIRDQESDGPCPELAEAEFDAAFGALVGEENWWMYKNVALRRMTVLEVADAAGISREAAKKRVQRTAAKLKRGC